MKRILIIDDTEVWANHVAQDLRVREYRVACAATPAEADRLLDSFRPDLVVLDVDLGGLEGLNILRRMRAARLIHGSRVIVLTYRSERPIVEAALKLGVRDYLLKSDRAPDELMERIDERLSRKGAANPTVESRLDGNAAPTRENASGATPLPRRQQVAALEAPASSCSSRTATEPAKPSAATGGLRDLKPMMTRQEMIDLVRRGGDLSPMSPSVDEVLKLVRSASCSIDQVAKAIRRDHVLAVKLLRLANSTAYSRGDAVESVEKAVVRIGLAKIRQVLANLNVVDTFHAFAIPERVTATTFWEHSIGCAIVAAQIAEATGQEPDAAFTMGLVHDVGRLVYANLLDTRYVDVVSAAEDLNLPLERVESRMLLLDHAAAMDHLLHHWRFPKELIEPVVCHHLSPDEIRKRSPKHISQIAALALADQLVHALLIGSSGNDTIYPFDELCKLLQLDPSVIHEIESSIDERTDDLKIAMISTSSIGPWPSYRSQLQERLAAPLKPLFLCGDSRVDPYRMFFDRLTSADTEAFNVAVIHFDGRRGRDDLSAELVSRERDAGCDPLPVIAISKNGDLAPKPEIVGERVVRQLSAPTPINSILVEVNRFVAPREAAEALAG